MDSTAKFPDIHFAIYPRRIIQFSCKTPGSRDNFLHFEHNSEQLTVFSFSRHFLTVNTVVYVHRDHETSSRNWYEKRGSRFLALKLLFFTQKSHVGFEV